MVSAVVVWIVKDNESYETSYVRGVFSSAEKAMKSIPARWEMDTDGEWIAYEPDPLVLFPMTVDEVPS